MSDIIKDITPILMYLSVSSFIKTTIANKNITPIYNQTGISKSSGATLKDQAINSANMDSGKVLIIIFSKQNW